jgi:hypothetical protein
VSASRSATDGRSSSLRERPRGLLRPWHSATDTGILDEERRIVLSGDDRLPAISSSGLVDRKVESGTPTRTHALLDYRKELPQTEATELERV